MTKRQTPRANTSAWLEYRAFKTSSGARYPRVPTHVVHSLLIGVFQLISAYVGKTKIG